ncbi:MAG: hypothetical protein WCK96_19595 [Methylococcales bacterium]
MRTANKYSKVSQDVGKNSPAPYICGISSDETLFEDIKNEELTHELSALAYFNECRQLYPYIETLIFEFDCYMFKGYLKEQKVSVTTEEGTSATIDYEPKIKLLANCSIRLVYSVIDDSQDDKQRMEYYLEIYSEREKNRWIRPFTTNELAQANLFKVALLNYKQSFLGNNEDLTDLVNYLFNAQSPEIRALSAIGYDEKSQGYYFPTFAYDEDGKKIYTNNDNYFHYVNIKPFKNYSDTITNESNPIDLNQFLTLMNTAYGCKGLLALGFYIASLFSQKIFDHYCFFPFLSLYGSPHAGKSFISKLLNRCLFIDSEGQTMTTSNTAKGELRKISQQSSLVHALLEGRKNGITVSRIAENHAIELGGIACFVKALKHEDISVPDLIKYTIERAKHKLEMAKTETHLADCFFESITELRLNRANGVAIHHDELVIQLPRVLNYLKQHGNNFNKNKLIDELINHDWFIIKKSTRCFGKPAEAYHFRNEASIVS